MLTDMKALCHLGISCVVYSCSKGPRIYSRQRTGYTQSYFTAEKCLEKMNYNFRLIARVQREFCLTLAY